MTRSLSVQLPETKLHRNPLPEGAYLESIGYETQKEIREEQTTQLQEQIVLLQSLCEKITREVELPAQAIAGLGDLLFRVRGIVDRDAK